VIPRFARSVDSSEQFEDRDHLARAIVGAKQGDMSALHFLYVRFADDVCGYVRSIVRDSHEAEDITQNVFAKLMTAIHKYEPRDVPFAAWILRVARNMALDHLRARRQIPFEEVRTDDDGHEQIGFERSQCLRDALWRLPQEQREVLVLRHLAGLSPGEIARRLGKTEGSIHGLHHRGRSALKAALSELDAAPVIAASV
jgi:RNA polymerase sigma-70 factor (ECF subfamily)